MIEHLSDDDDRMDATATLTALDEMRRVMAEDTTWPSAISWTRVIDEDGVNQAMSIETLGRMALSRYVADELDAGRAVAVEVADGWLVSSLPG